MTRDYHRWYSRSLGRHMELLVFGHAGPPFVVFPTSMGAFFEYEDRGMVAAVRDKLDHGRLQLYCVSSVDGESWYAGGVHPRQRVERHLQYETYILGDVVSLVRQLNHSPGIGVTGCSFGAYHAMAIALRHPYVFTSCVTISGAFDISQFLGGWSDQDAYLLNPPWFLPELGEAYYLNQVPAQQDSSWPPESGTSAAPPTKASRGCSARKASRTRCTCGGPAASTTGRTGCRWPAPTCRKVLD